MSYNITYKKYVASLIRLQLLALCIFPRLFDYQVGYNARFRSIPGP